MTKIHSSEPHWGFLIAWDHNQLSYSWSQMGWKSGKEWVSNMKASFTVPRCPLTDIHLNQYCLHSLLSLQSPSTCRQTGKANLRWYLWAFVVKVFAFANKDKRMYFYSSRLLVQSQDIKCVHQTMYFVI